MNAWGNAWGDSWGSSWGTSIPVEGILDVTEAKDTSHITQNNLYRFGTISVREFPDTLRVTGYKDALGVVSILEPVDIGSILGGIRGTGTISVFEDFVDTLSAAGFREDSGRLVALEATDAVSVLGGVEVTGSTTLVEIPDNFNTTGTVLLTWDFIPSEQQDTFRASNLPFTLNQNSSLYVLPKYTVVKIADAAGNFRIENRGIELVNIKYSATVPSIFDNDWGTVSNRILEIDLEIDMDLYAYSDFGGELIVYAEVI